MPLTAMRVLRIIGIEEDEMEAKLFKVLVSAGGGAAEGEI
jgi:hypothetical protein